MSGKLPVFTHSQMIGNRSASILKSIMQKFCAFPEIDQSQDLGIDFIGTVILKNHPTDYNFNAQCKGTDNIEIKLNADKTIFSYSIKVTTINYWKQKKDTTFLFIVDEINAQIYWGTPLKEIENIDLSAQDSYTFHIPKSNCLNNKTKELPESFIYEIIRYYANFSGNAIKNFDRLQSNMGIIHDPGKMLELMSILEKNFKEVEIKYKETINLLIEKIKFDLERSLCYCNELEQMDDIVRVYCPNGVFNTPFSTGKRNLTINEFRGVIDNLVKSNNVSYKELYELSKEVSEFRGNFLGFLREMVYEDMPFSNHDNIDQEFMSWQNERR